MRNKYFSSSDILQRKNEMKVKVKFLVLIYLWDVLRLFSKTILSRIHLSPTIYLRDRSNLVLTTRECRAKSCSSSYSINSRAISRVLYCVNAIKESKKKRRRKRSRKHQATVEQLGWIICYSYSIIDRLFKYE